jgi:hypothetical protein
MCANDSPRATPTGRLAREVRDRGDAALALLADQLGHYAAKP